MIQDSEEDERKEVMLSSCGFGGDVCKPSAGEIEIDCPEAGVGGGGCRWTADRQMAFSVFGQKPKVIDRFEGGGLTRTSRIGTGRYSQGRQFARIPLV